MGKITVYENGKRRGSTSQAFNVVTKKELMREYTLDFSILNNNPIYKEITVSSVFENKGQLFDITGIDTDSGNENVSSISAEHVSYRTNKYTVPVNYAFVGTVKAILQDILTISGASDEFSIGECCNIGTVSFAMNNEKEATARAAIFAMSAIGVEIDYDNFVINVPQRIGQDIGKVFRFGVDLQNFRRRWQIGNGWTYDIAIADIQKNPNYEGITFGLGDDVTAEDSFIGDSVKNRIISYVENDDNPAENSITMGVFVADAESNNVETSRIANTANDTANTANATAEEAQKKADNSVQQGEKYSNVSITHKDGFMATNKAGTQRVMMNADDCFVVQVKKNGEWVTVNTLELFGLLVDRLTSLSAKDKFYIQIGETDSGEYGLLFYIDGKRGFEMSSPNSNMVILKTERGIVLESTNNDAISYFKARNLSIQTANLISENTDTGDWGRGYTGEITFHTGKSSESTTYKSLKIINGIITGI